MKKILILILFVCLFDLAMFAQKGEVVFSKSSKKTESAAEFKSGEFIFAHLKFPQAIAEMLTLNERPVTFLTEFYSNGKMIDDEMFGFDTAKVKGSKINSMILPIISDPSGDVPTWGKNLFSTRFPAALAKLPAGKYEIQYKVKSYNFKDANETMAEGNFILQIENGATAWFKQNEKDSYEALSKRGVSSVVVSERDLAMGVVGGKSVITLVNNCGRSVWLRNALGSDKREYRLSPSQTMKYDRDSGYLEEWNFGTKKWSTVTKVWSTDSSGKANICSK